MRVHKCQVSFPRDRFDAYTFYNNTVQLSRQNILPPKALPRNKRRLRRVIKQSNHYSVLYLVSKQFRTRERVVSISFRVISREEISVTRNYDRPPRHCSSYDVILQSCLYQRFICGVGVMVYLTFFRRYNKIRRVISLRHGLKYDR